MSASGGIDASKIAYDEKNTVALSLTNGLTREIGTSAHGECPYVLFLGAGASVSSGIDASNSLVQKWQQEIFCDIHEREFPIGEESGKLLEEFGRWIRNDFEGWFEQAIGDYGDKKERMYSTLFEYMRQSKESRQTFIEELISRPEVEPSIGYFYLASLLQEKIVGCVLTTNFDELIADALFSYYDSRPIVCAFESSISNFNNSSTRPKIIKLHGDYLFNDIRNTDSELVALDINMENKMIELCQDRGLVFVGYGGNDGSIMDPIMKQMQVNSRFLTKDLHWCIRRNANRKKQDRARIHKDELPKNVWILKKRFPKRVHIYEIDSFDHLMCQIYSDSGMSSEACFKDASERSVSKRFIRAVEKLKRSNILHQQMAVDYEHAADFLSEKTTGVEKALKRANIYWENGRNQRDKYSNYNAAISTFTKGIKTVNECLSSEKPDPDDLAGLINRKIACQIGNLKCLQAIGNTSELKDQFTKIIETETEIDKLLAADISRNANSSVYSSVYYNLICANCLKATYEVSAFSDVKERILDYIDVLRKSKEGREKVQKLKTKEPDIGTFSGEIFSTQSAKKKSRRN